MVNDYGQTRIAMSVVPLNVRDIDPAPILSAMQQKENAEFNVVVVVNCQKWCLRYGIDAQTQNRIGLSPW